MRLREGEQVVVGGAAGVDGASLQERADLVQRGGVVPVALTVNGYSTRRRRVETEDQAHRRRLARAVRPQEARHDPWLDGEGEPVDGALVAVVLGELPRLDHGSDPTCRL